MLRKLRKLQDNVFTTFHITVELNGLHWTRGLSLPADLQELPQILFGNSPLPPQLERWEFLGVDPAADGLLVDAEPVGDLGDRKQTVRARGCLGHTRSPSPVGS